MTRVPANEVLWSVINYCYIADQRSYLENKDNHQRKHCEKGIFIEKGTLYFRVVLEKKTTFSSNFKRSSSRAEAMHAMLYTC